MLGWGRSSQASPPGVEKDEKDEKDEKASSEGPTRSTRPIKREGSARKIIARAQEGPERRITAMPAIQQRAAGPCNPQTDTGCWGICGGASPCGIAPCDDGSQKRRKTW